METKTYKFARIDWAQDRTWRWSAENAAAGDMDSGTVTGDRLRDAIHSMMVELELSCEVDDFQIYECNTSDNGNYAVWRKHEAAQ